jgi:predicted RNA-binding Zn ribbon-like protein
MKRPPRYDVPNAAPEPLRLVQLFVNTVDHEHGRELLATPAQLEEWFAEHGLETGRTGLAAVRKAQALREALRDLIASGRDSAPLAVAARRARLNIDFGDGRLVPQADGLDGALGVLVAIVYEAMRDGTWSRLKTCRNCNWAFWDESRNRSATWCSMTLCGNRLKVRRYRSRRAAAGGKR